MIFRTKVLSMAVALIGLMATTSLADVSHTCNFFTSALKIQEIQEPADGKTYHHLELTDSWFKTELVGSPELPYRSIQLLLPADDEVQGITVTGSTSQRLVGEFNVYSAQPPWIVGQPQPPFALPDPTTYLSLEPYPGKLAEIVHDGYLSGYHLVSIRVYPVQYAPALKKLTFYTEINFKVKTQKGVNKAVPVYRRSPLVQAEMEKLVTSLVENPEALQLEGSRFKVQGAKKNQKGIVVEPITIKSLPSIEGSGVDYLIITNEALKNAFQPLADWKTKKGVTADIRTVEWIQANYSGCDLQEKIRNFIKDAYSHWGVGYVLLAGDTPIISDRKVKNPDFWYAHLAPFMPTDLYYSSLEGNWNDNGNAVFGDLYSEYYDPNFTIVTFLDADSGMIVKDNEIQCTTNGGKTWFDMPEKAPVYEITDMGFISSNNGWVGGELEGVRIVYTNDGGSTWQTQLEKINTDSLTYFFYDLDIINAQIGWAVGKLKKIEESQGDTILKQPLLIRYYSKLWHMSDGQSWTEINGPDFIAYGLDFIDNITGYLVGEAGKIAKTTNGGATWQTYQAATTSTLRHVIFIDEQTGWACGDSGVVLHTTNGGTSWEVQNSGVTEDLCDIKFVDANYGWAISNSSILYTTNGGGTWQESSNPGGWILFSISAVSSNNIWISGQHGLLMHSDDGVNWYVKYSGILHIVYSDEVDLFPDLAVGRAPVETIEEANVFVNKVLNYERNPSLE